MIGLLLFLKKKRFLHWLCCFLCCTYTCIHIYDKFGFYFSLTTVAFTTLTINNHFTIGCLVSTQFWIGWATKWGNKLWSQYKLSCYRISFLLLSFLCQQCPLCIVLPQFNMSSGLSLRAKQYQWVAYPYAKLWIAQEQNPPWCSKALSFFGGGGRGG